MGKLLLLFTIVPIVELYLLVLLGDLMGFWATMAVILTTGLVGAWLAKREGLRVFTRWREAIAQGRMPEEGILAGLLVLVGGVLLVTPGVLTDVTGLLLLFPPSRRVIAGYVKRYAERKIRDGSVRVVSYDVQMGAMGPMGPVGPMGRRPAPRPRGEVIDVEGEVVDVTPRVDNLGSGV